MCEVGLDLMCVFTDPLGMTDIGGTLAKHSQHGGKVTAVILWEYPEETKRQIAEAASILGIEPLVLGWEKGKINVDSETKGKLVKIIREKQPDIMITFDHEFAISTTHGDHIITHNLVMESLGLCYRKDVFPSHFEEGLSPHVVKSVYYPLWSPYTLPDVVVNIDDTFDAKVRATLALKDQLKIHGQFLPQIYDDDILQKIISSHGTVKDDPIEVGTAFNLDNRWIEGRFWGRSVWITGTAFGEPFRRREPMKVDYLPI